MHLRRLALALASGLLVFSAVALAVLDNHFEERNCGSAIIPRDTSQIAVQSGDVADDDFALQRLVDGCDHAIWARRYLTGVMILGGIVLGVLAARSKPRVVRFPGDPIV